MENNIVENINSTPELLNAIQVLSGLHLEKKKGLKVDYSMRNSEQILETLNSIINKYDLKLFIVTEFYQSLALQGVFYTEMIKSTRYENSKPIDKYDLLETPLIFEKNTVIVKIIGYGGEFKNTCIFQSPLLNFREKNMSQNQKAGSSKSYYTKYALESMFAIDGAKDDDYLADQKTAKTTEVRKTQNNSDPNPKEMPVFDKVICEKATAFLQITNDVAQIEKQLMRLKNYTPDPQGLHTKTILEFETKIKTLKNV